MNRADMRTLAMSWLDDLNQSYFTPAQVNTWITFAIRQTQQMLLQAGNNWYAKPVETLTTVGQADYLFPTDFLVEHRIEIVLNGTGPQENRQSLKPITLNQQDLVSIVTGTPTNYYIKKDRFTISPTPQQQWVMRLYYSPMVLDLVDDVTAIDVPPQFLEYVALLTAQNGYVKDDRVPDNLLAKMGAFEVLFKQMAVDRTQDQSRMVVETYNSDYGALF